MWIGPQAGIYCPVGFTEEIDAYKPADCMFWQRRGGGKAVLLQRE